MTFDEEADHVIRQLQRDPSREELWSRFFKVQRPRLYHFLYALSAGNKTTTEDLVQEAFLRFIRYGGIDRVPDSHSAAAYLRTIARNLFLKHVRESGAAREVSASDDKVLLGLESVLERRTQIQTFEQDLHILLGEIAEIDRELLTMILCGLPLAQIAVRLDITYGAAAQRVHRLRKKFEMAIQPRTKKAHPT